jgi:hypothetical protein
MGLSSERSAAELAGRIIDAHPQIGLALPCEPLLSQIDVQGLLTLPERNNGVRLFGARNRVRGDGV